MPVYVSIDLTINGNRPGQRVAAWASPADEATKNAKGSHVVTRHYGRLAANTAISWGMVGETSEDVRRRSTIKPLTTRVTDEHGSLGVLEFPVGTYAFWPSDDETRRVEIEWPAGEGDVEIVLD